MEINFQTHLNQEAISMKKVTKFKGRYRSNSSNKFVGVRQRSSGKWIAEIKDTTHKKIRMWLGTFDTAEEAARAYDEAACLLRGSNTRTNFVTTRVSPDSQLAYRIRDLLDKKKLDKQGRISAFASTCCRSTSTVDSVSTEKIQENHLLEGNVLNSFYDEKIQENQLFDNLYKPTVSSATTVQSQTSRDQLYESSLVHSSSTQAENNLYKLTTSAATAPRSQTSHDRLYESSFLHLSPSQAENNLYKPDMINCLDGFDTSSCSSQAEVPWGFEFAQELLGFPMMGESRGEMGYTEFERMKVERQISASLYAVNGVQEYMETVYEDPIDLSLWDLPPLCSLLS